MTEYLESGRAELRKSFPSSLHSFQCNSNYSFFQLLEGTKIKNKYIFSVTICCFQIVKEGYKYDFLCLKNINELPLAAFSSCAEKCLEQPAGDRFYTCDFSQNLQLPNGDINLLSTLRYQGQSWTAIRHLCCNVDVQVKIWFQALS